MTCDDGDWCNGNDSCDGSGNCAIHEFPDGDRNFECECSTSGHWYDVNTELCWQDPPSDSGMNWDEASTYCSEHAWDQHNDWRLPNINELISLIRGCRDGDSSNASSLSICEAYCPVTDDICNGIGENCTGCEANEGFGNNGYYWDPALSGTGMEYWSSSSRLAYNSQAFVARFDTGTVRHIQKGFPVDSVHCVRGGQ